MYKHELIYTHTHMYTDMCVYVTWLENFYITFYIYLYLILQVSVTQLRLNIYHNKNK